MSLVITLLTVFLVMVSLLLVLITLMQRPKQEGLGAAFGGGMMSDTFGAQTTDVLQKSTVWLTVAFFGTAILLTVLNTRYYEKQRDVGNILEGVQKLESLPSFPGLDGLTPTEATPSTDSKTSTPATDAPASKAAGKEDVKGEAAEATGPAKETKTSEPAKSTPETPAATVDTDKDKSAESDSKKVPPPVEADAAKLPAGEVDKK